MPCWLQFRYKRGRVTRWLEPGMPQASRGTEWILGIITPPSASQHSCHQSASLPCVDPGSGEEHRPPAPHWLSRLGTTSATKPWFWPSCLLEPPHSGGAQSPNACVLTRTVGEPAPHLLGTCWRCPWLLKVSAADQAAAQTPPVLLCLSIHGCMFTGRLKFEEPCSDVES